MCRPEFGISVAAIDETIFVIRKCHPRSRSRHT